MRINSRRVEKSADFSALVTPRDSRTSKSAVSDRPLPITRLSIITARKRRGEGRNKKKRGKRTLSIDRSIFFIFRTAKNFSIFATLPSGCYRVSIFHFVGAESSDRGDAAQITGEQGWKGRERERKK